jgi:hypothetical protein
MKWLKPALGVLSVVALTGAGGFAHADDSCVYARDQECDEPSVGGTGACRDGTDSTDCQAMPRSANSCLWANDNECDEPRYYGTGACGDGTDSNDCRGLPLAALGPDSCRWANDNECDEPRYEGTGYCNDGTDTSDCTGTTSATAGPNSCSWANDGECDEARFGGTGACPNGTDTADCSGGPGGGTGPTTLSKWTSITPDQRQFAAQPGGVMPLVVFNDSSFEAGLYMVYYGNADSDGRQISQWQTLGPVQLDSNRRYLAELGGPSRLDFREAGGALIMYSEPGPGRAMVYARNRDVIHWNAICILPVGMDPMEDCFGGYSNIVYVPPAGATPTPAGEPSTVCEAFMRQYPSVCVIPAGDDEDVMIDALRTECCRN